MCLLQPEVDLSFGSGKVFVTKYDSKYTSQKAFVMAIFRGNSLA